MMNRLGASAMAWTMLLFCGSAMAQLPKSARLFEQNCLACHGYAPGQRGPDATALRQMTPERIVQALDRGAAHDQARLLTEADKRAIGEFLSGRNFMAGNEGDAAAMPNQCGNHPPIATLSAAPQWNGRAWTRLMDAFSRPRQQG